MSLQKQDFLMRQIQFLTQILQQIIFKKNQDKQQEAVDEIKDAFRRLSRDHPKEFHKLTLEETVSFFERQGKFQSELAVAVADLLFEEGNIRRDKSFSASQKCHAQALILYKKTLKDESASVPLDIRKTISTLNEKLAHSDYLTKVNAVFEP